MINHLITIYFGKIENIKIGKKIKKKITPFGQYHAFKADGNIFLRKRLIGKKCTFGAREGQTHKKRKPERRKRNYINLRIDY